MQVTLKLYCRTDENKLPYAVGIPCLLCRGLLTGHFVCQNNTCGTFS